MRTAGMTAAARAAESSRDDRLFEDNYAFRASGAEGALLLSRAGGDRTTATVAVRTWWIDARMREAALRGVRAFVLLGAGFDARPLRCAIASARFVCLDTAATLAERRARLPPDDAHVHPVDLLSDDVDTALARGLETLGDAPRCIIAEGLFAYLPPRAVSRALRALARLSPSSTCLLFDVPSRAVLSHESPTTATLRALNEPLRFGTNELAQVLHANGWRATHITHVGNADAHCGRLPELPSTNESAEQLRTLLAAAVPLRSPSPPAPAALDDDDPLSYFAESDPVPHGDVDWFAAFGGPVLDVGAGTGRIALPLARRGAEVLAVDASPVMVMILRERLALAERDVQERVRVLRADIKDAELLRGPFSTAILADSVLSTLADPLAVLRNVRNALHPDGRIALSVVDPTTLDPRGVRLRPGPLTRHVRTGAPYVRWIGADPITSDEQRVFGFYAVSWPAPQRIPFEYRLRLYTRATLTALLEHAGFVDVAFDEVLHGRLFVRARRGRPRGARDKARP